VKEVIKICNNCGNQVFYDFHRNCFCCNNNLCKNQYLPLYSINLPGQYIKEIDNYIILQGTITEYI
jgi:hypothetical protein